MGHTGRLNLDVLEHPSQARYPGQRILVVRINGYVHLVSYVDGIPYQTLISSILHQFVSGELQERSAR